MKKQKLTLVILGLFVVSLVPIQGIFGALDQDKQAAESKVAQFRSQLESVKGQADEILGKVESVQKQIDSVKGRIASLDNEKVILEHNIVEKEAQVEVAKAAFDAKKSDVYQRARQVYEDGDTDYTAVVLASFDLTDFINNSEYYSIIKKKETQRVNEIKEERVKLEEQKKELEVAQVALEENKQKAVVEQGNLEVENQKLEISKSIVDEAVASKTSQLNAEEAALASINAEIADAQARYAAQIAALEKEAAGANNNSGGNASGGGTTGGSDTGNTGCGGNTGGGSSGGGNVSSSGFIWPASGSVTSEYGPRWGTMHRGLDIVASHGAPIVAANRGVVLAAGFTGDGFGGKVVIQHANGLITLYGHMSSVGASAGSTVERGQYIGAVGNTGDSFGAHLHFQVSNTGNMYDGVNPRNYLP
ncbi:hypothetical protein AZF37_09350 [endosymbiont 'TC1' of Trimyema compressum]|uniref:murein hydrolase activator EnvC family protein n=1 Tax=endosymbiont 'TC1' of Trimyema compressum TaxID=243899 RepID=UPI0007F08EA8|nr:M23 family metallopeptidase [endosymbiont 'TC1' of Trimyema compressum]AMP21323.1 hypothetical protein AZF37_09350 [endosymbiont 'TC1' of Trimyema compressum]